MNDTICLTLEQLNAQTSDWSVAVFLLVLVIIVIFFLWTVREANRDK